MWLPVVGLPPTSFEGRSPLVRISGTDGRPVPSGPSVTDKTLPQTLLRRPSRKSYLGPRVSVVSSIGTTELDQVECLDWMDHPDPSKSVCLSVCLTDSTLPHVNGGHWFWGTHRSHRLMSTRPLPPVGLGLHFRLGTSGFVTLSSGYT